MSACSEFFALAINCRASPMEVEKRQANEGLALTCCQQKAAHRLWVEAERTAAQRSAREQRSETVSVAERGWHRLAEVVRASSSSRHCSPEERRCYGPCRPAWTPSVGGPGGQPQVRAKPPQVAAAPQVPLQE